MRDSIKGIAPSAAAEIRIPESTTAEATESARDDTVTNGQGSTVLAAASTTGVNTTFASAAKSVASGDSTGVANVVGRAVSVLAGNTWNGTTGDSPAMWTLLAAARRELSGAATPTANAEAVAPTLVVGDYDLFATTPLHVVSFYGTPARWPAPPGTVQGVQNFDIKDSNGVTVQSVTAVVDNTNDDAKNGGRYNEILVTDVTYSSGETDPLPVGSIVADYNLYGFGYTYSAIPTESGKDKVSFAIVTPLGNIPIRHTLITTFDAAEYLDDNSLTSHVQVGLANGYYISAARVGTEDITAVGGIPPLFNCIQGQDVFAVYQDGTDTPVPGNFTAYVTTTKDLVGGYTELIMVTDTNGSTNVGTDPGQIPPVGSVFNVYHAWNLKSYIIYAAMPTDTGTDVYLRLATPWLTITIPRIFVSVDATMPYSTSVVPLNNGNLLEATSDLRISGGNGLPPREMITQGYQQFVYKNADGIPIEAFDSDVTTQTLASGDSRVSILVTKVNSSDGDAVLPVGSVINITHSEILGIGTYYSSVPTALGTVVTYQYVTPWGRIPRYTSYNASDGLTGYTYYTPFSEELLPEV